MLSENFEIINSILDNLNENVILIDPAGSAFTPGSKSYLGGGLSGFIYNKFNLSGKSHNLGHIKTGSAILNNELNYDEINPKIKGLIHAVGPNGGDKKIFDKWLERTIISISITIFQNFAQYKNLEIRIPMISAGIYGIPEYSGCPENFCKYFELYYKLIDKYICQYYSKKGFKIKLGVWSRNEKAGWKMFLEKYKSS